jgi:hypothetical protein
LWPRLRQRESYIYALHNFEHLEEHYAHQTALNILRVLDAHLSWGKPVPRSFARQILRIPEHESLESWLATLPARASNPKEGEKLQEEVERCLEPALGQEPYSALPGVLSAAEKLHAITYNQTATRAFEEAWWNDICRLANGAYVNKENADCVHDQATLARLSHRHRDLESLGVYLMKCHRHSIATAEMENKAECGEIPFHWNTDFDFSGFGGWKNNQEGHTHERDLLVIIPGKNRKEAIVMADHYDTAYMEDIYYK